MSDLKKVDIVEACWIEEPSWCEYCDHKPEKTFLPFNKNVLNPEHICEKCAKNETDNLPVEFNIVDFFETEEKYRVELFKLKK